MLPFNHRFHTGFKVSLRRRKERKEKSFFILRDFAVKKPHRLDNLEKHKWSHYNN